MHYEFPLIRNIADVLPAIQDRPEFVVAEKEGYTVINYNVAFADTFPEVIVVNGDEFYQNEHAALRRECRGIIFDTATGDIIRRPYHKFFNVNEREETQTHRVNLGHPNAILEKLDGSMCSVFRHPITQDLVFGTKMCAEDFHQKIKKFVSKSDISYIEFCQDMISSSYTPIFEYYEKSKRIVLDYGEEFLTLTAIRHMNTGEYVSY